MGSSPSRKTTRLFCTAPGSGGPYKNALFLVLDKSNLLLLFSPRIREGFGKARNREIRGRRAAGNGCNDARRHEGEGREQANVPFTPAFTLGDLRERCKLTEPDVIDPCAGLG